MFESFINLLLHLAGLPSKAWHIIHSKCFASNIFQCKAGPPPPKKNPSQIFQYNLNIITAFILTFEVSVNVTWLPTLACKISRDLQVKPGKGIISTESSFQNIHSYQIADLCNFGINSYSRKYPDPIWRLATHNHKVEYSVITVQLYSDNWLLCVWIHQTD